MPRSPNETPARNFRLSAETLADLDRISDHHGLESRTAAIRIAAKAMADSLPKPPKKNPRKSGQVC